MVEDGRPSERGHVGIGCWLGLFLIPVVLLRLLLMHLHPTEQRKAVLRLVRDRKIRRDPYSQRIRYEHVDTRRDLTVRVAELIRMHWIGPDLNVLDEGRQHLEEKR